MCYSCWVSDYGAPVVASPEVLAAAELIRHLYEDLGERTGGPLHAMLDDLNIDDGQVDQAIGGKYDHFAYLWDGSFERHSQAGEDVSVEHRQAIEATCRQILTIFDHVPMSWRAAAIGWYEGWQKQYLSDLPSDEGFFPQPFASAEEIADVLAEFERPAAPEGDGCAVPCPPFQAEQVEPEVEQPKAGMGHAACKGWGVFGEPHVLRCSCGEPISMWPWTVAAG